VASPPVPDAFSLARARCVQRTNEYRARVSAPALGSRSDQLTCADNAARTDAAAKTPHSAFGQCNESAQNECPAFKGNVDTAIDRCLKMMFDEGPGQGPAHGHYTNMTNTSYRSVACGFHVTPDGALWVVQNFYR
jgi:hypothetical protein